MLTNPIKNGLQISQNSQLRPGKYIFLRIIDCFDGMPLTWTVGTSPNAELTNTMLEDAISTVVHGEKPIVHSDRGCHYRWPEWIRLITEAGLTRSMSKKGCSPDKSNCTFSIFDFTSIHYINPPKTPRGAFISQELIHSPSISKHSCTSCTANPSEACSQRYSIKSLSCFG